MKLTPLDIHNKEFHRAIRGYNEEEVDKFLDEVAEEFERLFKENIELKEQLEKAKQELEDYFSMERTLQNTLLVAQKSAEDITMQAQKQAELIFRDAELKAKEVIQESYDLKRKYKSTLSHLKQAEEDFRNKFKSMLESYMRIADSTASLANIVNDVPELNEESTVEEETVVSVEPPKIGLVKVEEADTQLISGNYTAETYVPDNVVSETHGAK
ncbi:MAG: DivIVA domain-containing protein [Actinobacteria bacterium]|nr:DivIVA domain-containing protein [Actinomycetota bacterium]